MNVMTRFTLKSLRANFVRTLVTVAGVALAAALITAILTTFTSLVGYLQHVEQYQAGSWMILAEDEPGSDAAQSTARVQDAIHASDVEGLAAFTDVGFGELSEEQQAIFGQYLPILDLSFTKGSVQQLCALEASSGRMPQAEGEIMLPNNWRQYSSVEVGDSFTIGVGQRVAVPVDEAAATSENAYVPVLTSSSAYLDPRYDDGQFSEKLEDVRQRTYTVVGFYDENNNVTTTSFGLVAITAGDPQAAGMRSIYLALSGIDSAEQLDDRTEELFPGAGLIPHTSLLRYMGIRGHGAIWLTFYGIVGVLAAIVVIACVSLIYNAFAISVAERVRQFALLSSVGASRRQLRRAVFVEGLLIALIGIPLGLLVGLGGCAVTFHFLGSQIAAVIGSAEIPFTLTISVPALVIAAVLTLVTVLISVWIPSKRASRAAIVDTLRNAGTAHVTKKGVRDAQNAARNRRFWRGRGVVARVFGIGGNLAVINRKRGVAKGRAASVSLALAIVLLMTAGSLSVYLGQLVNAASYDSRCDIELIATDNGQRGSRFFDSQSPEDVMHYFEDVYNAAAAMPGLESLGWGLVSSQPVFVPEAMLGSAANQLTGTYTVTGLNAGAGNATYASLGFVPDAQFDAFARESGRDLSAQVEAGELCAVAIGNLYGNVEGKYTMMQAISEPGTVQVLNGGTLNGHEIAGFCYAYDGELDEMGRELISRMDPYYVGSDDTMISVESGQSDVTIETLDLNVGVVSQQLPPIALSDSQLQFILPLSALPAFNMTIGAPSLTVDFNVVSGTSEEAAKELQNTVESAGVPSVFVLDYASETRNMQMIVTVVNVFCLLFAVILALIAMANVFNTVTNSLILRKREFAVMRSVGMSGRQFRSMIADECLSFGIAGFIPGFIIAALVAYLLWHMVSLSMSGPAFMFPWNYALGAAIMTAAAMVLSVAYGMHRCKADNIVEALRTESM